MPLAVWAGVLDSVTGAPGFEGSERVAVELGGIVMLRVSVSPSSFHALLIFP